MLAKVVKTDSIKSVVRSFGKGYNYVAIITTGNGKDYSSTISPCDFRGRTKGPVMKTEQHINKAVAEDYHERLIEEYGAAAKGNFLCLVKTVQDTRRDEGVVVVETNIRKLDDKKVGSCNFESLVFMPNGKMRCGDEDAIDAIGTGYKRYDKGSLIEKALVGHTTIMQVWR